jgi:hypothetical protein
MHYYITKGSGIPKIIPEILIYRSLLYITLGENMPPKSKLPKGKVRLEVLISEDLYKLLVEVAPSIYGGSRYRGALSAIVEEALRYYLNLKAHTKGTQNPLAQ